MLFDTTFLIDFEREVKRNRPAAPGFLTQHTNVPLYISIISVSEFAEGFNGFQQQDCWLCLSHYTVLDLTRDIAWQAGQISRQLRVSSGQTVGDSDILIASTALYHGLPLVTGNRQHFQRIPGLNVVGY